MRTGSHRARGLRARSASGKRQQSDIAGALDGHAQPALVTRTNTGHAARENLPALLHELRKNVRALVVDEVNLLDTELADFLLAEILALAAWPPPRAARTARTAFAPPTSGAAFPPSAPGTAFVPRSSAATWRWCLFLIFCHTYHPSEFCVVSFKF